MSKRRRIMLTFEVRTPLPPGRKQAELPDLIRAQLLGDQSPFKSMELQVRITKREVTYL